MKRERLSDLAKKLQPYHKSTNGSVTVIAGDSGSGGDHAHVLSDIDGELLRTQAPWVADDISTAVANHAAIVDAHHAKQHGITDSANHTVAGAQYSVVGLSAANTLGVLATTNRGDLNTNTILRSGSSNELYVSTLYSPVITTASGNLSLKPSSGTVVFTNTSNVDRASIAIGNNTLDINPLPDASGDMNVRLFRSTSTTGSKALLLLAGNNSTAVVHQLSVSGTTVFNAQLSNLDTNIRGDTDTNLIYVDASADSVGFGTQTPAYKVDVVGSARATVSVITPILTNTTNLSISPSGDLTIDPTGNVVFPVAQTIKTSNFSSSFPVAGFQINENPSISGGSVLTIGKIAVNELTADIFVANETRVDRGNMYWSKGFAILYSNYTTPSSIGSTFPIVFENSPHIAGALFSDNDWVMFQQVDIDTGFTLATVWGQVAGYTPSSDRQTWTFTLRGGPTSTLIKKGRVAVNFGASGQSLIHLSTVDSTGSPYIRFRKWTGTDPISPSNYSTFTQIGNIGNLFGTTNEYGLFAGDGVTINDKYLRLSDSPSFNNIPINMSSGGVTKVRLDATYGLDILLPSSELAMQAITWRSTLSSGSPITRLDSWATGDSTTLLAEVVATTANPAGTILIRAYNNVGTHPAGINLISPPTGSSSAGIYGDIVAVGTLLSATYLNAASAIYINADLDLNNNDIYDVATVAIGLSTAGATLDVARGSLSGGTAIFRGTTHGSHFNYSTDEHTFIRGGKDGSIVYINDTHYGPIVALGGRIQFRSDDSATGFWIRYDGGNTVISAKAGDIYYGYSGVSGLSHKYYAGGTGEVARIDSQGIKSFGNLSVGTSYNLTNGVACGNISIDYSPNSSNWSTTGTTLLLSASDYSTIGFHDSLSRVDYIRAGGGVITIGYDGGFGAARVDFGGIVGGTWQSLSMGSGWVAWDGGSSWHPGQCKKVGDIVIIRGLVRRSSGSGTLIATLPSGYRPSKNEAFDCLCYNGSSYETSCRVDINTDGTINLVTGNGNGFVSLAGIVICTS